MNGKELRPREQHCDDLAYATKRLDILERASDRLQAKETELRSAANLPYSSSAHENELVLAPDLSPSSAVSQSGTPSTPIENKGREPTPVNMGTSPTDDVVRHLYPFAHPVAAALHRAYETGALREGDFSDKYLRSALSLAMGSCNCETSRQLANRARK